jgi:hypothetical protein
MKQREQALLSDLGVRFRKTHEEDYDAVASLDRHAARAALRELRAFVDIRLRERTGP